MKQNIKGIENYGNTCYINSVIQQLFNLNILKTLFLIN
jgi:ubiquitin C-terminal hydrolase